MSFQTPAEEIATLKQAVRELSDGKWDKGDIKAIALIFGVLASLAMSAYSLASVATPDAPSLVVDSADTDAGTGLPGSGTEG